MTKKIAIGFDYTHNNKLTIENNAFTDFTHYWFDSSFQLGKIEAGITLDKLSKYDILIIGVPTLGPDLDPDEIKDLVSYVKNGGSLLIIIDVLWCSRWSILFDRLRKQRNVFKENSNET